VAITIQSRRPIWYQRKITTTDTAAEAGYADTSQQLHSLMNSVVLDILSIYAEIHASDAPLDTNAIDPISSKAMKFIEFAQTDTHCRRAAVFAFFAAALVASLIRLKFPFDDMVDDDGDLMQLHDDDIPALVVPCWFSVVDDEDAGAITFSES